MFLLRHYGYRQMLAALVAAPMALAARFVICLAPPGGFYDWPFASQRAAANLISGFWVLAFGAWLAAVAGYLLWLTPLGWRSRARSLNGLVFAATGAPGVWLIIKALGALAASPPEMMETIAWVALWATLAPAALGAVPLALVEAGEWLRARNELMSLLYAGRGAYATWCPAYQLRRFAQPIPEEL